MTLEKVSRDLISQHDEFLMLLDDDGAIVATSFRSHYSAPCSHYSARVPYAIGQ